MGREKRRKMRREKARIVQKIRRDSSRMMYIIFLPFPCEKEVQISLSPFLNYPPHMQLLHVIDQLQTVSEAHPTTTHLLLPERDMEAHPTTPHPLMVDEDTETHKEISCSDRLESGSVGEVTQLTDSLKPEVPSLASNSGVQGLPLGALGDERSLSHGASSPQHAEMQATPVTEMTEVGGPVSHEASSPQHAETQDIPMGDIPHEPAARTDSPSFPLPRDILPHSLRPVLHETTPLSPSRSVKEKQKAHVKFQERPPRVQGRPPGEQGRKMGSQAASQRYASVCRCY